MVTSHLPSFRSRTIGIGIPRKLHLPLFLLRGLSLVPASYGFISYIIAAEHVPFRDSGGLLELRSTELDYWLGAMWCLLSGLWSYWLADGLMRRWLFYYEVTSIIIRLISLQAINWVVTAFVVTHYGPDEPVWAWVVCSIVLGICNVIQWLFTSTTKYVKANDPETLRQMTLRDIQRYIVIPLAIAAFVTMLFLLEQQSKFRYTSNLGLTNYKLHTNLSLNEIKSDSKVKVIMVILTSWAESGYQKRMNFRETTIKLIPQNSNKISLAYRFILGDAPSAKVHMNMGKKILAESERYNDLLIVPASDLYDNLSHKVYKSFEWANKYDFNYFVKTDDDMFVRMDTVVRELEELGSGQKYYWRGLGNIPIHNSNNKNSAFDYKLPMFPPFTAGSLYILSRDIISIITTDAPRLFTKNEEENLGIWLFPYNIKPIHDRRIQKADVCEDDMIAKHFSDSYDPDRSMKDMYENVINNRRTCEGFRQRFCALCYPCWGRENNWRGRGFDCDDVKGITLLRQTEVLLDKSETSIKVFDKPQNITMGSKEDEWIIPGLLSEHSSIYSGTNQWYLLHWLYWTTDLSTFQERHYKTIELIWVHTPNAIVFVLTTTLPDDFFTKYLEQGYRIYVIKFNKELLLKRHWYLGQNSKNWLKNWNKWEKSQYFLSHLTDYMRYILLHKYGGMYMDIDSLWIRTPPDTQIEFIGSDYSKIASDSEWTLDKDGTYLSPGIMRFRKGWSMFREIAERAFSPTYTTDCFNCVGPRAITMYVKEYRNTLEENGFTILPGRILYPYNYLEVDKLLNYDRTAIQELSKIEKNSWSIHLFGKMTNFKTIEDSSVVGVTIKKFSLDIPHSPAPLIGNGKPSFQNRNLSYPFVLEGPKQYRFTFMTTIKEIDQYAGSLNGKFEGLYVIFVRGGPPTALKSIIYAKANKGKLSFNSNGGDWSETSITISNPTKKDVNAILNTLIYRPNKILQKTGGKDVIELKVTFGEHRTKLSIEVLIPVPK
ncbi:8842_t:CDS:2 [Diversispora eburnea]|uniref:8842_t:CDS:1 n=1 Tax=Diversispora eburnea TaxID=1213867 RepID=A0A9N9G0D9_9GLOM|nr:8842_t:CDS:2 [Diversispora eburnea]